MAGWVAGWLAGWLGGWLAGWLAGWLSQQPHGRSELTVSYTRRGSALLTCGLAGAGTVGETDASSGWAKADGDNPFARPDEPVSSLRSMLRKERVRGRAASATRHRVDSRCPLRRYSCVLTAPFARGRGSKPANRAPRDPPMRLCRSSNSPYLHSYVKWCMSV